MRSFLLVLLSILCLTCVASAVNFESIDLSRSKIEPGNPFRVEVTLKYPDSSYQVHFYMDDYAFSVQNVGSDNENVRSSDWNWDLVELNCGEHTARAELKRFNISIENITTTFDIGKLPDVSFDPENPLTDRTLTVTLTDPEGGSPASGVKVDVYNTVSGRTEKKTTDTAGKFTYRPENYGRYRMTFTHKEYCGKKEFQAKKLLTVDGPHPENPVVGELISVALPSDVGVKVLDDKGNTFLNAKTIIGGGANFTISKSGTYIIVMGGGDRESYWGVNKTIVVLDKGVLRINVEPSEAVVGEPVTIKVDSGGSPIDSAVVTVTAPDNSLNVYTTPSSGTLVYVPLAVGTYTVVVEKEKYKAVDKSFESKKKLYISFSPRSPKVGEDVTLTVKDKDGNPVADALVSIDGGKSEATDASGVYVTKLIEVKTYTITASKESFMYWGSEEKLTVRGSLNLTLNPDAVEVGEEARIIVVDGMGKPITAELNVTKPDGLQQSLKDTSYIPDEPGNHTITASKDGYETAVKVFYVSTHSISLNYTIEKKMLTVAISSNGMPVQDINVKLINPYNDSSATDSNGLTYFTIQSAGDYVFEVNKEKIKKEYESKTVTEKIIKKRNTILLALPVIIVVSLAALAVFVVYQFKRRKKGRGTVRKKSGGEAPLERSEKSTLAKV